MTDAESSGGTACERCGNARATDGHGDVLDYDRLCVSCLKELLPEKIDYRKVEA